MPIIGVAIVFIPKILENSISGKVIKAKTVNVFIISLDLFERSD
jgi:hypothetical protein